jgi:hypothetical protein
MVFLELIRVQSTGESVAPLKNGVWKLIQKELDGLGLTRGRIFFRVGQTGEAIVMLLWDRETFDPRGSALSQLLVSELKKHGLVNYSAWIEGQDLKT